jgi:AraC family transcriptional regulator of adaptative response/methylated-DNA-[protein]-cysteine methyltransferase
LSLAPFKSRKPAFAARRFDDGPFRARPPEEIRYGTGKCALGPVLVASSDEGIVTIMIRDKASRCLPELRQRFPKSSLVRDERGCAPVVAKVIEYIARPAGRFPLRLDIRGTEFQQRVWQEVRKIPFGQTSSYSKIAEAIGAPKAVRAVASSCSRSWFAFAVPCHRVLHSQGADPARRDKPGSIQYKWAAYESKLLERKKAA